MYYSLFDGEQEARDEDELQTNQKKDAEQRKATLDETRKTCESHIEESDKAYQKGAWLAFQRDEEKKRISKEVVISPSLDDSGLVERKEQEIYAISSGGVTILDVLLLFAFVHQMLDIMGVENLVSRVFAQIVIPPALVAIEAYLSFRLNKNLTGKRFRVMSILIPTALALISGVTYLSWDGVLGFGDLDFVNVSLALGLTFIAAAVHYAVVLGAPDIPTLLARIELDRRRKKYARLSKEAESHFRDSTRSFLRSMWEVRKLEKDHGVKADSHLDSIPSDLAEFLSKRIQADRMHIPSKLNQNGAERPASSPPAAESARGIASTTEDSTS